MSTISSITDPQIVAQGVGVAKPPHADKGQCNSGGATSGTQKGDTVEISDQARAASGADGVRTGLIREIKALIQDNLYESEDKVDGAAGRIVRDLTA